MLKESPDSFRFGKASSDFSNHIDSSFLKEPDFNCCCLPDVSVLILFIS
jgi:hypothetical protein